MNIISIFFVVSGILLSIFVYFDARKRPQPMLIMRIVWPLTMLWASWVGLIAYFWFGREKSIIETMGMMPGMSGRMSMQGGMDMDSIQIPKPKWQGIALSTLHCGAGCVMADIIGETTSGIFGLTMMSGWGLDYILALVCGVFFQYMAISEMEKVTIKKTLVRAVKSDLLSLSAWQVGMYGFMWVYFSYFSLTGFNRASFEFSFVMQLAMITGFIFSYPMNMLLIKMGLKNSM